MNLASFSGSGRKTSALVAQTILWLSVALGIVGINVYASQFSAKVWVSIASTGFLVAGASLGVGGILGFLFGIPRAQQGEVTEKTRNRYDPNTNLEQISDWLTKILVGVGLTQIAQLPELNERLTSFLSPALGDSESSEAFASALVVYFSIAGFLIGYLWTSLYLATLYTDRDRDLEEGALRLQLKAASQKTGLVLEPDVESKLVRRAQDINVRGRPARVLWVDDHPDNNHFERQALLGLGVSVATASSTDEALSALADSQARGLPFDLLITDMGRGGERGAGEDMAQRIRAAGQSIPLIFYTSSVDRSRPVPSVAFGITDRPDELVQLVLDALAKR